jgi:ribonuclease D
MSDGNEPAQPTPLNKPRCVDVRLIETSSDLETATEALLGGIGPLAIDAERASGFKYSQRAYLIQLHRTNAPILLIDPIAIYSDDTEAFAKLSKAIAGIPWILHAATQDIPCLAELGLRPSKLIDTELAGRLLGLDRVGLGSMVQELLSLALAKEHSAADWSTRPLPETWLNYAALDVDVLPELADRLLKELAAANKLEWAEQEFTHLLSFAPRPVKADKWRGTSGLNTIRDERGYAVVRALWSAREELGKRLDVSPGRLIPDSSIIELAITKPKTKGEMSANKRFAGRASRSYLDTWWAALNEGLKDLRPPELRVKSEGIPNHRIWAHKHPLADARLQVLKLIMTRLSTEYGLPTENILTPDYMRQLAWHLEITAADDIRDFLASCGARLWQLDLVSEEFSAGLAAQSTVETQSSQAAEHEEP